MEFSFPVTKIFKDKISKVKNDLIPEGFSDPGPLGRQCPQYVAQAVNALGVASAAAQGLAHPVTSADRLRNSDHTLYVMVDNSNGSKNGRIVGFLKTGHKNLFLYDKNGRNHETKPLCVLDFFIHDALQRRGLGKELFDYMLRDVDIAPKHLALDRPSDTFMAFVKKHYGLFKTIPQVNYYAIYDDFFSKRHDGKSQYHSRLHGPTTLKGGRQSVARRSLPSVMSQQHHAPQSNGQQHQPQSKQNRQCQQQQPQQHLQQHQLLLPHQLQQQHDLPQNQVHQQYPQVPQHQMAQQQREVAQRHIQASQLPQFQEKSQHHQQQSQHMADEQNVQPPESDVHQESEQHQQQHQSFLQSDADGHEMSQSHPEQHQQQQQSGEPQQQQQSTEAKFLQDRPFGSQTPQAQRQQQYQQQGGGQNAPDTPHGPDNKSSSVGQCLTYAEAGNRWGPNHPAAPYVSRPAAGKVFADPNPVMLMAPDGAHEPGSQPPPMHCAPGAAMGECLTYALAGNRWGPDHPAAPYVSRPAAGKATMIPAPNGTVMMVPSEGVQGSQPPSPFCSPPGSPGAAGPPHSPLVAGGDGYGVAEPGSPGGSSGGSSSSQDKSAAARAYEVNRKAKYTHTPLW